MPSSVLSSDSMHLGLLAAAAHAAATNSRFTIFYNPRYDCASEREFWISYLPSKCFFTSLSGLVHQNSSYRWLNILKLVIILKCLLACALGCCLKQKNQVSVGRLSFIVIFTYDSYDYCDWVSISWHFVGHWSEKSPPTNYCPNVT